MEKQLGGEKEEERERERRERERERGEREREVRGTPSHLSARERIVVAENVREERERESGMAEANKQFSFIFLSFIPQPLQDPFPSIAELFFSFKVFLGSKKT